MATDKKKKTIFKVIYIILAIIIILAVLYIIKYFFDKYKNISNNGNIYDDIKINSDEITKNKTEKMLKVEELKKINSDVIGWLEIKGTNINYPVLQCTDNSYYMTHDYKKDSSKNGSLFLDKDYNWSIPSTNLLIYGHNMQDGLMFSDLLNYKDESFYKEHPTINFTTENDDSEYEIISAFESRVYYKSEKNVFRYYFFVNANNENEYNEFIENAKSASLYDTGKTAKYNDKLITLSTCSYHTEDGRFAVVARKK